jgi:hypothetical protein
MKIFIYIAIISFIGFIGILIKGIYDAKKLMNLLDDVNGELDIIFSEFEDNEHSPENTISDETIKRTVLRNKLKQIDDPKYSLKKKR